LNNEPVKSIEQPFSKEWM